ncbi:arachidonate 12-lipoxygenase, 12S-type isoform 1-T1 [Synchiropus picturatus]
MEVYTVTVVTGSKEYAGTKNLIYVTLVGEEGESERTMLDNVGLDFNRGSVDQYKVNSPSPLGTVLLVRLEKQKFFVDDKWFCSYVTVEPPAGGKLLTFPCYRWLVGDVVMELREGTAKLQKDDLLPVLQNHRKSELQERQEAYRWVTWVPGLPRCIDAPTEADLPPDVRFDNQKKSDFEHSLQFALVELSLKKLAIKFGKSWDDLEDFKRIFLKLKSPVAEYCMDHWQDDNFFGYQILNGSNPRMIQRCERLPDKFPVTAAMVQSSMSAQTNLDKELKAGNIYLLDYAIMDGIPANKVKGQPQYVAAPLCLLHQSPDGELLPIAIQLGQTPGLDTPIFLPTDPQLAWLLAKIWVRHAEFQVFELLSHLLRTHLVVEVICVATQRQLPAVHPIYKLLTPHLRYTLEINCRGRTQLISEDGIFKQVTSTGGEGMVLLAQREYKLLTYRSLQPRYDFVDRGVTQLPNYFYRDHALMLWDAIHKFVSDMVQLFYKCDQEVQEDLELQAWLRDIVQEGFAELPDFGLASELKTLDELSTLLAVIIFTCSAQHAATNNGQFDWCAWVPNTPCSMRQPPPVNKDAVTMETIMTSLPDVSQSCVQMAITWHLGRAQPDAVSHLHSLLSPSVPLGKYIEEYFTQKQAVEVIGSFKVELLKIETNILSQNKGLALKYLYLLPSTIENSITI